MWTKLIDMDLLDAAAGHAPEGGDLPHPTEPVESTASSELTASELSASIEPTASAAPIAPAPIAPAAPIVSIEPVELEVGDGLTERERQMLAFEKQWWRQPGAKEQAIRDVFEVSATQYYQALNALLDNPAALEYDPILVGRLRRLRATRSRTRGRMTPRTAA
jgi:hypothetical protein